VDCIILATGICILNAAFYSPALISLNFLVSFSKFFVILFFPLPLKFFKNFIFTSEVKLSSESAEKVRNEKLENLDAELREARARIQQLQQATRSENL
jgi:uncharacterized protein YlxW (UPF0749 family)